LLPNLADIEDMTGPIHPLASGIAGSSYAAERVTAERAKAVKRTESKLKQGTAEDFFDRQIETAEQVDAIHDDDTHPQHKKRKQPPEKESADPNADRPNLDITG
jgi:hypothetical protein